MAAFADVEVVACATSAELFEKQLEIELDARALEVYETVFPGFKEAAASAAPFMPTIWFDRQITFGSGARKAVFTRVGGHSSDSSAVVFAAEGVVIAGDLMQTHKRPYFGDPTTDLGAWIEALQGWEALEPDKVSPGHGPVVDHQYLTQVRTYFEKLVVTLQDLKVQEVPLEQAVSHSSLPTGYWPADAAKPPWWEHSIAGAYMQLQ